MNDKQRTDWEQKRKIGRSKYLLYYGVLLWSLSLTVLFGAIEWISQGEMYAGWIPVRLILFAVAGFFIANSRWQSKERQFAAFAEKRP